MAHSSLLDRDIESILVSPDEIDRITSEIAAKIDADYRDSGKRLLLLCILKGSVVFMGDLMKKISIPVEIDFMKVSSYGKSTSTSGRINIILDLQRKDLSELDIVVVEDIIDSGRTLSYLVEYLKLGGAHSVKTCTKTRNLNAHFSASSRKLFCLLFKIGGIWVKCVVCTDLQGFFPFCFIRVNGYNGYRA